MASAGRVLLIPKGEWTSGEDYEMLDVVYDNGSSYVAKTNVLGSTVHPENDGTHWQLLASGFSQGGDTSGLNVLKRAMHYAVGDIAYATSAPSWCVLVCKTAGTTALSEPADYASIAVSGGTITDGTAVFEVRDGRAGTNLAQTVTTTSHPALSAGQGVIIDGQLYVITKSVAANATLVAGTNMIAATAMDQLYNTQAGKIFSIASSGWVLDSTTNLYKYTLNATRVYSPTPEISLSGASVGEQATSEQETAFGLLTASGHYAETDDNTVHLFASAAPESSFYVLIKGVV